MNRTDAPVRSATKRGLLPRFGLRFLFAFLIVASLLVGWIARNVHRVRQEDAALEALKRAGAALHFEYADENAAIAPADGSFDLPYFVPRVLGLDRLAVRSAELAVYEDDPKNPVVAPALAALGTFPEIESLRLEGLAVDDAGIASLARLPNLKSLTLECTDVTAEGLAQIAPHVPLRKIEIYDDRLNTNLAEGLAEFGDLQQVDLRGLPLSQANLERVCRMPRIERLRLRYLQPAGPEVEFAEGDADFEAILARLYEDEADLDLACVRQLKGLRELMVTNADDEDLESLGRMPSLEELRAFGSVTVEGIREFSLANPDCTVVYIASSNLPAWMKAGEEVARPAD